MDNWKTDFQQDIIDLLSRKRGGHVERWLYSDITHDGITGSGLWGAFLRAAGNYYVLPNEIALIESASAALEDQLSAYDTIIDLGVGSEQSVSCKVLPITNHAKNALTYGPVDISADYLRGAEDVVRRHTSLDVRPVIGNFFHDALMLPGRNRLSLFFGATISNMDAMEGEDFPRQEIIGKLSHLAGLLRNGHKNLMLVSFDSNSDPASIIAAYEDIHWKRFVANLSYSMATVLDIEGDFRPSAWHHESVWDDSSRVLHHMITASQDQSFKIAGHVFDVKRGDRFVAINCFKFPVEWFQGMAEEAGFTVNEPFVDRQNKMVVQPLELT